MVRIRYCDKCGENCEGNHHTIALCSAHYDLCPKCYPPIKNRIQNLIKKPPEPEEKE